MRQIILDTETTGLEVADGHRIIEIGCVELRNRQETGYNYHQYLQPDREIDQGAFEVHGIDNAFLADKPRFADIASEFLDYIDGAELIIHNAEFDVGFLNAELDNWRANESIAAHCQVLDTLLLARELHPGKRNSLDALCKRYAIDNSQRTLHGALLDAQILADVYLAMTGGQSSLALEPARDQRAELLSAEFSQAERVALPVIKASAAELELHMKMRAQIVEKYGCCYWDKHENPEEFARGQQARMQAQAAAPPPLEDMDDDDNAAGEDYLDANANGEFQLSAG